MEETDLTPLGELLAELSKIDNEEIDQSISLECIPTLYKEISAATTIRKIYDIEGIADKFNNMFRSIILSLESVKEFNALEKIFGSLFANIEIDYLKIRLQDEED